MNIDPFHTAPRAEVAAGARHFAHVQAGTFPSAKERKAARRETEAEMRARLAHEFDEIEAGTRADLQAAEGRRAAERAIYGRQIAQDAETPADRKEGPHEAGRAVAGPETRSLPMQYRSDMMKVR